MSAGVAAIPAGRVSMRGLLRSEWTKVRTVRSTIWALGAVLVVGLATSGITTSITRAHWATMSAGSKATFNPITSSLLGLFFGDALILGVLGILVVSAEYATGTIRASFAAAPRRPTVLAAKVLVFAAISLIVGEIVAFASFFLGQAFLTAPATHATLSSPGALRDITGTGLFLCVISLFALGIAIIIRHTAGAISAYVGIAIVLPLAIEAFPTSLQNDIHRYLPFQIGATMIGNPDKGSFSPWVGFGILCGYAAATLIIGTILAIRRDA